MKGQSSRDTPFIELQCAQTESTSAGKVDEMLKLFRTTVPRLRQCQPERQRQPL